MLHAAPFAIPRTVVVVQRHTSGAQIQRLLPAKVVSSKGVLLNKSLRTKTWHGEHFRHRSDP
jgi:hypothetical protein